MSSELCTCGDPTSPAVHRSVGPCLAVDGTGRALKHCQCPACKDGTIHHSDCAVHADESAEQKPCSCGVLVCDECGGPYDGGCLVCGNPNGESGPCVTKTTDPHAEVEERDHLIRRGLLPNPNECGECVGIEYAEDFHMLIPIYENGLRELANRAARLQREMREAWQANERTRVVSSRRGDALVYLANVLDLTEVQRQMVEYVLGPAR